MRLAAARTVWLSYTPGFLSLAHTHTTHTVNHSDVPTTVCACVYSSRTDTIIIVCVCVSAAARACARTTTTECVGAGGGGGGDGSFVRGTTSMEKIIKKKKIRRTKRREEREREKKSDGRRKKKKKSKVKRGADNSGRKRFNRKRGTPTNTAVSVFTRREQAAAPRDLRPRFIIVQTDLKNGIHLFLFSAENRFLYFVREHCVP